MESQRRVRDLERHATQARVFHSPSDNVSCKILPHGALCTVFSADLTFVFNQGSPGRVVSGLRLPRSAGELTPYGSTVSAGVITCLMPAVSSEPRGVICSDSASGHGFEASRVAERQRTF